MREGRKERGRGGGIREIKRKGGEKKDGYLVITQHHYCKAPTMNLCSGSNCITILSIGINNRVYHKPATHSQECGLLGNDSI